MEKNKEKKMGVMFGWDEFLEWVCLIILFDFFIFNVYIPTWNVFGGF